MWQTSVVLCAVAVVSLGVRTDDPVDLVQVLAGTEAISGGSVSDGNTLPQIKMPWGFNDWVPQTDSDRGAWFFSRNSTKFQGVRCTHQPSPFVNDYGYFLMQPHTSEDPGETYWTPDESAFRPYLFNATFDDGIQFELVPTSHAALLRLHYPFPTQSLARFSVMDVAGASIYSPDNSTIQGQAVGNNGAVPKLWNGLYVTLRALTPSNVVGRGVFEFENNGGPILVAVGTSFISQAQAELNLEREVGQKTFEELVTEGKATWAAKLARVQVDAIDETQLAVFYTNLWKTMLFPRYLQEVNENGTEVHRSPYTNKIREGKLVADSGFWDSYRTVYHLQSLVFPDNMGGLIEGFVNAFDEAGWLPEWPAPGKFNIMPSTMGDVVLADAIVKSKLGVLSGFDTDKAYDAIRKDAFIPGKAGYGRSCLKAYVERGYVPSDFCVGSVSLTLNNYVADAAIARAAGALGKHEDEVVLRERSKRYNVIFNKDNHFFQPKRSDGYFYENFQPLEWGKGFTEAGAWQYRFYLPHDVEGLKKLYDGKLCETIQAMLEDTKGRAFLTGSYGQKIHEMKELSAIQSEFGLYAHGNQPVHHVLYVAKKAGCDRIADKYLRKVTKKLYTKRGWAGDEDNGEMSAWYILSTLGVYGLEGGKDELVLGSPAIKQATVQLPNQKLLTVIAENQADDHVYVQSVMWAPEGGSPRLVTGNVLKFTEVAHGGTLTFKMGAAPKSESRLRARKQRQSASFLEIGHEKN